MDVSPSYLLLAVLAVGAVFLFSLAPRTKGAFVPTFEQRPMMNKTERRLFRMLRDDLPSDWTVMCQVSYGAFLSNRSYSRYMSMNSKRADFVILDPLLDVAVVVEYQGRGHYGNTARSRQRATASDKLKRQALGEAGIFLLEIPAEFDRGFLRDFAIQLAGPESERVVSPSNP